MRPRSTPALELFGDEDKNYERRDQQAKRLERERERAQDESNAEERPKTTMMTRKLGVSLAGETVEKSAVSAIR